MTSGFGRARSCASDGTARTSVISIGARASFAIPTSIVQRVWVTEVVPEELAQKVTAGFMTPQVRRPHPASATRRITPTATGTGLRRTDHAAPGPSSPWRSASGARVRVPAVAEAVDPPTGSGAGPGPAAGPRPGPETWSSSNDPTRRTGQGALRQ